MKTILIKSKDDQVVITLELWEKEKAFFRRYGYKIYEIKSKTNSSFWKKTEESNDVVKIERKSVFVGKITTDRKEEIKQFIDLQKEYYKIKGKYLNNHTAKRNFKWSIYELECRLLTEKQDLSKVNNIEKRGWEYNLDHIISVKYGFDNNIPPHKIASLGNLRIIDRKTNKRKGARLEEGYEKILKKIL